MNDLHLNEDLKVLRDLRDRVAEEMFGVEPVINALLIALLARGHVLLEGNPGLGKTALVRTLANSLGLTEPMGRLVKKSVGRIQFTPDLMPSDITGTKLPDENDKLVFQRGPIFSNLLLADEINRATPKTQSAMLEAMAEYQVTVLGETWQLTEDIPLRIGGTGGQVERRVRTPFLVLATQNPVEQEGTNPLPEAQLDRFQFKLRLPFPNRETLKVIVQKDVARSIGAPSKDGMDPRETVGRIDRLGEALRGISPAETVRRHILNMVLATAGQPDQVKGIGHRRQKTLEEFCSGEIDYPLGPRAAVALTLSTLGWAAVEGVRDNEVEQVAAATPEALANVIIPTLRHRTRFASSFDGFGTANGLQERHDDLLRELACLAAPDESATVFAERLAAAKVAFPF